MKNEQIIFTRVNTAELLPIEWCEPQAGEVTVQTELSTISPGTERANLVGDPNVSGNAPSSVRFPRTVGYSSTGTVVAIGEGVTTVAVGDRVVVYWGKHKRYNTVPEKNVIKIEDAAITPATAALAFIATFPMAAIRKTHLELGEPALVMGLGLLGQLAVRLLRAAGAVPIVAVDPVASRRAEALAGGADYVLDPTEEGFADRVKSITKGGAKVAIEVTGVGAGLDGALDCMAKFGRVSLLGCTRDKEFTIDYYKKVHFPGITLIGAHTNARPKQESYGGYFTHEDDIRAVLALCAAGRLTLDDMVRETHRPEECGAVFNRLATDREFPIVVQFDWRK